ncbi:MAG: excinuclease ABC subunit UvrA [Patescibacteria group bacterium]
MSQSEKYIHIKGAKTHNLKNIELKIPRDKLTVITGLSGSGKSSLAFDTIFAEGQRRYIESLSAYARQFLRQMAKPDVEEITGLSPAISIDQKSRSQNPRSTVATITEIYDYLRVLLARVGQPKCLVCGREIKKLSHEEIIALTLEKISAIENSTTDWSLQIYAPLVRGRKGEYYQLLYDLLDKGYQEILLNDRRYNLRDRIILAKNKKHDLDVLVDEIEAADFNSGDQKETLAGKINMALSDDARNRLSEGVEKALKASDGLVRVVITQVGKTKKVLSQAEEAFLMSARFACPEDGFSYPEIEPRLFSFNSPYGACPECHGLGTKHLYGEEKCHLCQGARLRREALNVFLNSGKQELNIVEITALSIKEAVTFFNQLNLSKKEAEVAAVILKEIKSRLQFLLDVGLDYISLNRKANTLSGGEAQRIRLASQLGSRLVGTLYVLDEPTIGLHAKDNDQLLTTLLSLRDQGNTIIVVEHDEDTILVSDFLVDIGPRAGVHGGEVVVAEETAKLLKSKSNKNNSLTLDYLTGKKEVAVPSKKRTANKGFIKIRGGQIYNIKNLNVDIPLGKLISVTGVSGSGKSSFVYEILYQNLQRRLNRRYRTNKIVNCKEFTGSEYLSRSIMIDQSPIGRTPRSNLATYTGAFTFIRELLAETDLAKVRGWKPGRFSFNVKGGRCEACQGNGQLAVEMHFLPTIYVTCDVCQGKRFMTETLEVVYKGKNIYEILKMTVEEGLQFFTDIPAIADRLKTLDDVGLGYLELGQPATTLSGGEAQRVKISSELYRPMVYKSFYILDEPTVGLHYEDVANLIKVLQLLVDKGNTVLIIEHNMDVIKNSDYIIDMGPDGGQAGGRLVAFGLPESIIDSSDSHTAVYLKKYLKRSKFKA